MSKPSRRPDGARGPLSAIRVLDLSAYIAGPYGCSLFADQGAKIIKIEPPAGDKRKYPSTLESESRAFLDVNRSKLGLALDLKQPGWLRSRRWWPVPMCSCTTSGRACRRVSVLITSS